VLVALGVAAIVLAAVAAWAAGRGTPSRPTRADLDALRRRVAALECEQALGATRKPYLVLDLGAGTLRYRLMGMTVREIPIASFDARGLRRAGSGAGPAPVSVAGIFSLKEKQNDPRLSPLTPEQIEAGAADEDAADVLPPEAPALFDLEFRQPVRVRVEGIVQGEGRPGAFAAFWARLRGLFRPGVPSAGGRSGLLVSVRLDEESARQVYRSLVPGERWLVIPPAGLLLPEAGQEAPRTIRPARPAPPPPPVAPQPTAPGVPFQIPPPVEGVGGQGTEGVAPPPPGPPPEAAPPPAEEMPPGGEAVPEKEPTPAEPDTPPEGGLPPHHSPTPGEAAPGA
jgi:hypothetical protein